MPRVGRNNTTRNRQQSNSSNQFFADGCTQSENFDFNQLEPQLLQQVHPLFLYVMLLRQLDPKQNTGSSLSRTTLLYQKVVERNFIPRHLVPSSSSSSDPSSNDHKNHRYLKINAEYVKSKLQSDKARAFKNLPPATTSSASRRRQRVEYGSGGGGVTDQSLLDDEDDDDIQMGDNRIADEDDDEMILVSSEGISLKDANSANLIRVPARLKNCTHIQNCDLMSWCAPASAAKSARLIDNAQFQCPNCKSNGTFVDVQIDFFQLNEIIKMLEQKVHAKINTTGCKPLILWNKLGQLVASRQTPLPETLRLNADGTIELVEKTISQHDDALDVDALRLSQIELAPDFSKKNYDQFRVKTEPQDRKRNNLDDEEEFDEESLTDFEDDEEEEFDDDATEIGDKEEEKNQEEGNQNQNEQQQENRNHDQNLMMMMNNNNTTTTTTTTNNNNNNNNNNNTHITNNNEQEIKNEDKKIAANFLASSALMFNRNDNTPILPQPLPPMRGRPFCQGCSLFIPFPSSGDPSSAPSSQQQQQNNNNNNNNFSADSNYWVIPPNLLQNEVISCPKCQVTKAALKWSYVWSNKIQEKSHHNNNYDNSFDHLDPKADFICEFFPEDETIVLVINNHVLRSSVASLLMCWSDFEYFHPYKDPLPSKYEVDRELQTAKMKIEAAVGVFVRSANFSSRIDLDYLVSVVKVELENPGKGAWGNIKPLPPTMAQRERFQKQSTASSHVESIFNHHHNNNNNNNYYFSGSLSQPTHQPQPQHHYPNSGNTSQQTSNQLQNLASPPPQQQTFVGNNNNNNNQHFGNRATKWVPQQSQRH